MIIIEIILAVLLITCAVFAILYVSFIAMTPETMTFEEANKMFVEYTKIFFWTMTVYFKDVDTAKSIELGPFGKSGMDVSPMDIPLKGDVIKDDFDRFWEVMTREHYWTGARHEMTLHLKQL